MKIITSLDELAMIKVCDINDTDLQRVLGTYDFEEAMEERDCQYELKQLIPDEQFSWLGKHIKGKYILSVEPIPDDEHEIVWNFNLNVTFINDDDAVKYKMFWSGVQS